jgi:hypothetical protein
MTYPEDMLDGLDPTPEERLAFYRALDETEAEEDGAGGDYGPWDDGYEDQLSAIGDHLDARHASEADRVVADITDQLTRRPKDEVIAARALDRIADGSYLPDPYFRAQPREADGRFGSACGPVDEVTGRCAARYHGAGCGAAVASAAATGSYEAVESWNEVVAGHTHPPEVEMGLGLANPSEPWDGTDQWGGLLGNGDPATPGTPGYEALRAQIFHKMALADAPARPRDPGMPDTGWIRAQLGI